LSTRRLLLINQGNIQTKAGSIRGRGETCWPGTNHE
jgi:hypothetical protein